LVILNAKHVYKRENIPQSTNSSQCNLKRKVTTFDTGVFQSRIQIKRFDDVGCRGRNQSGLRQDVD